MTAARRKARPATSPPTRSAAPAFPTWVAAIVIVLAGAAAYANSFSGVFVFDDKNAIALNPCVRTLWPLKVAMDAPRDTTLAGRPVASLSFALTYAAAPADARDVFAALPGANGMTVDRFQRNLWGYHAANLAIHLLTALTLFGVARRTLRAPALAERFGNQADVLALAIPTIWVVHPLTTGAVTYIVQRVESLMGLFYLLTLYCAIRAAHGKSWTVLSIACCALGMGTKEAFVTAPVMVAAWDFLMLGDPWRLVRARRWPLYAGLASTWILIAAIMTFAPRSGSVGFGLQGVSPWAYLCTQAGVIAHYLRLAFVPWPLALDYEWPIAASLTSVLVPALIVLPLLGATVWGLVRREAWSFAGVWFFLILAPTSSVVPIITEVAADHRMYLPLAAIVACIVLSIVFISAEKTTRAITAVLTVVLVVVLGAMTYARNADYSSQERVYAKTVETRPSSARARSNLASVLIEEGRPKEAESLLREAIRLKPDYPEAHANLGVAYVVEGRAQDALAPFERAIALAPDYVAVWRNYGEALATLGRFADAARAFRKVLPSSPDDPDLLESLAWILATAPDASVRDGRSAVDLARRAAELSGNAPNVLDTLAAAYAENGQFADAAATAERALTLARSGGHSDLIPQLELRLQLYRDRQPYREGR
jgi:protein O-mannosyl-transferase